MEKPGNWFATVKMWKKHPKEKKFKKRICIFTQKFTLGKLSVPAWANQSPCFFVRGTSNPNGLFQTIRMSNDSIKHGVLFHCIVNC